MRKHFKYIFENTPQNNLSPITYLKTTLLFLVAETGPSSGQSGSTCEYYKFPSLEGKVILVLGGLCWWQQFFLKAFPQSHLLLFSGPCDGRGLSGRSPFANRGGGRKLQQGLSQDRAHHSVIIFSSFLPLMEFQRVLYKALEESRIRW